MSIWIKIHARWNQLRDWQKGGIIGGGVHLLAVIIILFLDIIFVPSQAPAGRGDMGTGGWWVLFFVYSVIEALPLLLLYLITGKNLIHSVTILREASWMNFSLWILYILYATVIYWILGMVTGRLIGTLGKINIKTNRQNKT